MANYACLCPVCHSVSYTEWGKKKCPQCGAKMYQSRATEIDYKNMPEERQKQAFLSMFDKNSPEYANVMLAFETPMSEEEKQLAEEKVRLANEEMVKQLQMQKEKDEAVSRMLISSGFSFEGYRIVKYSGYISGDDATTIPRVSGVFTSQHGQNLTDALVKIRIQALKELKEAAYDLGCNAVIGVDFDYLTLEPERASLLDSRVTVKEDYVICVTANGNAVVIEKI